MRVTITVPDLPAEVLHELAAQADRAGKPVEDYVRDLIVASVASPAVDGDGARLGTQHA
jgi:hypothetical protein